MYFLFLASRTMNSNCIIYSSYITLILKTLSKLHNKLYQDKIFEISFNKSGGFKFKGEQLHDFLLNIDKVGSKYIRINVKSTDNRGS